MIRRSNWEAVNFFSKYLAINSFDKYLVINRYTMTKCFSSSLSHTPPQAGLQHVGPNLQDKSGLPLQKYCVLSDQQATHHHLRKNIFRPNQQVTASPDKATLYLHP
jgi:hypothetical protein